LAKDIFESLGLKKNPFSMAADTEGYFHTETTKQILEELAFGIISRKGFLLLTGEVGVGKTSLLFQLLRKLEAEEKEDLVTAWVFNTMLNKEELLLAIARDFGLDPPKTSNVAQLVDILQAFLVEQNSEGKNCAIIIDEAHNLSLPALEALRMLSNLESEGRKLVQILLVGQTEIKARLDEAKLRQLRSRISIYRELQPFNRDETGRYVNFKLASASSEFRLEKTPQKILYAASLGNTRMINLIMERALYAAVAFGDADLSPRALRSAVAEIASCQVEVAERMNKKTKVIKTWASAAALVILALAVTVPYIPSEAGPQSVARVVIKRIAGPGDPEKPSRQVTSDAEGASEPKQAEEEVESKSIASKSPEITDNVLTTDVKGETSLEASLQEPKDYPAAYKEFLDRAGLGKLLPKLGSSIESKKVGVFEEALPKGYQLLRLDRLPSKTTVEYAAFPWKEYVEEEPEWLVVWKPALTINDFYYGYRSEDILVLQKMLKRLGYYWGPDDGMVGPVTWRAINGFQKDMKLKRTMWPDPETVFWLTVMATQHKKTSSKS
jgi:type II secretory pathway predicted ATPase ExeA